MSFKVIAATLLLALPAAGAEPLLPKLRIEPTTGGSILYVRNVSSQPLTAYVIELVGYPGSFFSLWKDEITYEPIAPNQEKRIPVENMTIGAAPDYVKVTGAVYADGTTAGVPAKIAQLIECRRFSLGSIRDLIHRVQMAQAQKASKETAASNIRNAMQFMLVPPGTDRSSQLWVNQAAARDFYNRTAHYLDQHDVDETLTMLQGWEKDLKQSKPPVRDM